MSDSTEKQVGYVSGFCSFVIPYQADSSFEQICYFTFFFGTNPDTVVDSISLQGHFTSAVSAVNGNETRKKKCLLLARLKFSCQ